MSEEPTIEQLKSEVLRLQAENEYLAGEADNVLHLRIFVEKLALEETVAGIENLAVESIATFKGLPYCAYLEVINDEALFVAADFSLDAATTCLGETMGLTEAVRQQIDQIESHVEVDSEQPGLAGFLPDSVRENCAGGYQFPVYLNEKLHGILFVTEDKRHAFIQEDGTHILGGLVEQMQYRLEHVNLLRLLEETVQERTRELRENQQKLALHMHNTPLGVISWDRNFDCTGWNNSAERIFGFTFEEIHGEKAMNFLVPADIVEHVDGAFEALLAQKGGTHSINENVTKDGRTILCEWFNTPLIDEDGTAFGVASLVQDITERERSREEMELARELADAANKAKSEFLANMSHEIRTPMNGVVGMSDLLSQSELSEKQHRMVEVIRSSSLSLLHIIDDILDFSKIEAGHLEFEIAPMSIREVIAGVVETVRPNLIEKNVACEVEVDSRIPEYIYGDAGRLRQILMNLCSNAVKFTTTEGGSNGSVSISARMLDSENLTLTVGDNGIGIAMEELDRLFEPFTQAEQSTRRRFGGTGLGLPITRNLVEGLGGRIEVESVLDQGSTFNIFLPIVVAPSPETEHRTGHVNASSASEIRRQAHSVLIVEDNETNLEVFAAQLQSCDCRIEIAHDGEEGLRKWREGNVDLILTDCNMPVMDGFQMTAEIRKEEATTCTHIPIIAITANAMHGESAKCLDAGMDDYLSKPVELIGLQNMLDKWLTETGHKDQHLTNLDPAGEGDLNPEIMIDLFGVDDPEKYMKYVDNFLKLIDSEIGLIMQALEGQGSLDPASQTAHKFKSTAFTLGMQSLGKICEVIEHQVADLDEAGKAALAVELNQALTRLKQAAASFRTANIT